MHIDSVHYPKSMSVSLRFHAILNGPRIYQTFRLVVLISSGTTTIKLPKFFMSDALMHKECLLLHFLQGFLMHCLEKTA